MSSYIYTFIRRDLSREQKIVQIGHACFEAGKAYGGEEGISNLVLLAAEDEHDLKRIARKLESKGIDLHIFFEPDNGMGYSAICTRPILDPDERKIFRNWDLFRYTD